MSPRILRDGQCAAALLEHLPPVQADIRQWMEKNTQVIKSDPHSKVGLAELNGQYCYLKYFTAKSFWQRPLFRLGMGRGVHSFDAAVVLAEAGIAVPEPLAVLSYPRGMLLITKALSGVQDFKAMWLGGLSVEEQLRLGEMAGEFLGALHLSGYAHGDMKWSNLLYVDGQLCLVDLEAVKPSSTDGSRAHRDLARFILNAEDMAMPPEAYERFLTGYFLPLVQRREQTLGKVLPILRELRRRHFKKYGERGNILLKDQ